VINCVHIHDGTAASREQECTILGECLVPSFFQAKDKMFPQSGHGESIILIYVTVQLGLYILPYKPKHAPGFYGQHPPGSDCHPADAGSTFCNKHCSKP
jgi:hypothetical protein